MIPQKARTHTSSRKMLNQPKKMHAGSTKKTAENDRFYKKRGESATSFYNGEISNYNALPLS
jgi:hypothetical protein